MKYFMKLYYTKFSLMCSKYFEIRLTNKYFIPKLNFKKVACIGKGDYPKSQAFKS